MGVTVMKTHELTDCGMPGIEQLRDWLQTQGASFPSLQIDFRDGRGSFYAGKSMVPGELVSHLPRSMLMTPELVQTSMSGQKIKARDIHLSDYGYLAVFVLKAGGEGSFWKPYIDTLPVDFPFHPMFFTEAELDYLNGSYALAILKEHKKNLLEEYRSLGPALPELGSFSCHEYARARCAVMARASRIVIDDKPVLGMDPATDMFRRSSKANARWIEDVTFGKAMLATDSIEPGERIYADNGRKSNSWLLAHCGFCLDDNPDNEVELAFPALLPSHPFYLCTKELGELRDDMRIFRVTTSFEDTAARALFSYLRVSGLGNLPNIFHSALMKAEANNIPPINRQNEMAALSMLAAACQRGMQRYATLLEEDERLLECGELPYKLRNAVIARRDEKRVLKRYADLSETAIPVLQNSSSRLDLHAKEIMPFVDYFSCLSSHWEQAVEGK